jgi:hypothetical protein
MAMNLFDLALFGGVAVVVLATVNHVSVKTQLSNMYGAMKGDIEKIKAALKIQ